MNTQISYVYRPGLLIAHGRIGKLPRPHGALTLNRPFKAPELELELTHSYMAQKSVLRGDVDARALRVCAARVRCACKAGRWLVVQTSAVSAMRLGGGVLSLSNRDAH